MSSLTDRKTAYKAPPTKLTDQKSSQNARRLKALEDQKRRRAQKYDSTRQLDLFADLNLGPSDDEAGDEPDIVREGIAGFKPLLSQEESSGVPGSAQHTNVMEVSASSSPTRKKRKGRGKQKAKANASLRMPSKWADQCMYAELLEMTDDSAWSEYDAGSSTDGLPDDLESGWVAVSPVPVGKRCLAVTHQSSGPNGIAPNTTIRSRLQGKPLMPRFPSPLPPSTVLDCILDANWKSNGILHVLDVLKWKGQDIGDCETPFRFWWRDTRLAELPRPPPPSMSASTTKPADHPQEMLQEPSVSALDSDRLQYQFSYPNTLVPIPYHTDTTLDNLAAQVIPMARSSRLVPILVPDPDAVPPSEAMTVDSNCQVPDVATLLGISAEIVADGLLLYMSEASYEAGTSPLSSWVPIVGYGESANSTPRATGKERPLELFERHVRRRLTEKVHKTDSVVADIEM